MQDADRGTLPRILNPAGVILGPLARSGLDALALPRFMLRHWAVLTALAVSGLAHAYGMWSYPEFDLDEGAILSQAWAVSHLGKIDPYTYWYDHPPLGWAFISPFTWFLDKVGVGTSAVENGRLVMLGVNLLTIFFLYQIMLRLTRSRSAALAVVLVMAVSPLAIVQQRMVKLDNIATMWALASLYLALGERPTLNRIWLSALALAIAALSKEPLVFFAPAVAYAVAQRVEGQRRLFALTGWTAIFVFTLSFYPLFALLKGELFPSGTLLGGNSAHVSLLGALFQSDRGETAGNPFSVLLFFRTWWHADPIFFTAGFCASAVNLVAAAKHRSARLAVLFIAPYLLFIARGGLVRDYWVIPLLPALAVNIAVAAVLAFGWLRRIEFDVLFRQTPVWQGLTHLGVLSVVAMGAFLGANSWSTYSAAFRNLFGQDMTTAYAQSLRWVEENVDPSSMLVVDATFWVDLQEARPPAAWRGIGGSTRVYGSYHYWVADRDPAVKSGVLEDDWRNVDYVVMTPFMEHDIAAGSVDFVKAIVDHSTLVAEFSSGYYWVRIMKVEKDAPPVGPAG
jgi:4-amino-4-deoxy-L-arabinose transferase-like glycosyltransferase